MWPEICSRIYNPFTPFELEGDGKRFAGVGLPLAPLLFYISQPLSRSPAAFVSLSFPAHAQDECGTVGLSHSYVLLVPVPFAFEDEVDTFPERFSYLDSYLFKSQSCKDAKARENIKNQKKEKSISDLLVMDLPERVVTGLSTSSSSSIKARMTSFESSSPPE